MKFLFALSLSIFAMGAFAQESLSDMKKMANEHISSKISTLETSKSCIDSAKTKEAFKACKYDLHEAMKMQKEEMKEEKRETMEE